MPQVRVLSPRPLILIFYAGVAQLVEQLICNQQVGGSSPSTSSIVLFYKISGRIPERPKGTDCKSVAFSFGGSNPPSPTIFFFFHKYLPISGRLLKFLSKRSPLFLSSIVVESNYFVTIKCIFVKLMLKDLYLFFKLFIVNFGKIQAKKITFLFYNFFLYKLLLLLLC